MGYAIREIELSRPLEAVHVSPAESGVGLIARWHDRLIGFRLVNLNGRRELSSDEVSVFANEAFAMAVLVARNEAELPARLMPRVPSLSIAICTKDRAARLRRLLGSLQGVCSKSPFDRVEIIVVDNASVDGATRDAAANAGVKYVFEPKAGLDFARNTAINSATGDVIAFLDDDVVVDRHYLDGLYAAWLSAPGAAGFTGLVLPFKLETEAQVCFEQRGGFGRGFKRQEFRPTSLAHPLHPVGAGRMGAGCNMAFNRELLVRLGGFDEALDTGKPLPGGGDLDMFYRVLRAGGTIVYEPRYAVYHEHRETMAQLRHQYWTWGLGMMAFLVKSWRADSVFRPKHLALIRWWLLDQLKSVGAAAARLRLRDFRLRVAELAGGIKGLLGEYDRSQKRVAAIRKSQS